MRWFARARSDSSQAASEPLDPPGPEPGPDPVPAPGTAPGWDAITAASAVAYPGQTPHRWAAVRRHRLGGDEPLDLVTVYRAVDPRPHWHYVTYGLSDLYTRLSHETSGSVGPSEGVDERSEATATPGPGVPSSPSPATARASDVPRPRPGLDDRSRAPRTSGFGFELTFRLVDPAAADPGAHPPVWPTALLSNLARYVVATSNAFAPGHFISTNGPLTTSAPTDLVALGFVEDPDLGTISTPCGQVRFLQAVGLTADEVSLASAWAMSSFLDLLVADDRGAPRGLTDLSRASIATDPTVRAQVEAATAREGSSIGVLYGEQVALDEDDDQTVLTLSTAAVPGVARTLLGRLPYGRPLRLVGNGGAVTLRPGPAFAVEASALVLDDGAAAAFADALVTDLGDHAVPGLPLLLRVVPTARRTQPEATPVSKQLARSASVSG